LAVVLTSQVTGRMELSWLQFRNQKHIRILTENEQMRQYRFYLDALAEQNYRQNKGPVQRPLRQQITGFLLQEDLFLIQQEDGSGIYITSYA
jgi:hypothetical protein